MGAETSKYKPEPKEARYRMEAARLGHLTLSDFELIYQYALSQKADWVKHFNAEPIGFVIDIDPLRDTFRVRPVVISNGQKFAHEWDKSSMTYGAVEPNQESFVLFSS